MSNRHPDKRDPRERMRGNRVKQVPQPRDDEPSEDEVADELARLMSEREVDDSED